MVGRRRKQGKRERNGRVQRESVAVDKTRSSVYVIEVPGAVKIGVSNSVPRRAGEIQTNHVSEVRVFWSANLPRQAAYQIERAVHEKLRKSVISRGEWFHVSARYAALVIRQEIEAAGISDWRLDHERDDPETIMPLAEWVA